MTGRAKGSGVPIPWSRLPDAAGCIESGRPLRARGSRPPDLSHPGPVLLLVLSAVVLSAVSMLLAAVGLAYDIQALQRVAVAARPVPTPVDHAGNGLDA